MTLFTVKTPTLETMREVAQELGFDNMGDEPPARVSEIQGARVLALLGDNITTDHISPAGSIKANSPAGVYLREHGVETKDFNSYGSRRGNDEFEKKGFFLRQNEMKRTT